MAEGGEGQQPEAEDVRDVEAENTPEDYRQGFEILAADLYFRGERAIRRNEDGSTTTIVSYTASLDAASWEGTGGVSKMRLLAAAAGMKEVMPPLVLPNPIPVTERGNAHNDVQLVYEESPAPDPLVTIDGTNARFM